MKKFLLSAFLISSFAYAAGTIPSANMGMPIPQVGVEPGPQWATDINNSLTIIDRHDHTPGNGVQITPDGINITKDLPFNGNNATLLRSSRYSAQGSPLSGSLDLGAVYVSGVDLYYNDELGNQVRITQNGSVTGVSGSITGLVSPASASYSPGTGTFIWQSDVNTAANMDFESAILRNGTASSFGLTLAAPTLTSDYAITLPLLPANNSLMSINTSGVITAGIGSFDQSTITSDGAVVKVPTGGITSTQIANNTIVAGNIANGAVGLPALASTVLQWNSATFTITTPGFNVRLASTANLGLTGLAAIDGVTPVGGDLILAKNQTTSSQDGVYVAASGAWARSTSYNTFTQLNYAGVHVTAGTVSTGLNYFQNNILTIITDPQSWSQSQTQPFVVPANVNYLYIQECGGGGGGGGGFTAADPDSGGGGGGSTPLQTFISVSPGDIVNITVGAKGFGGAGSTGGNGVAGGIGSDSNIKFGTSIILVKGGLGGGGAISGGGGAGGNTYPGFVYTTGSEVLSGSAGVHLFTTVPAAATSTLLVGSGATVSAGGGGNGGSGFGPGASGGVANAVGANAVSAGGGGGGGGASSSGNGFAGGNGSNGQVIISWLGHP